MVGSDLDGMVMRLLVMGAVLAALAGCAQPVRERSLSGIDFADGRTLASLQEALPLDERGALGTYALLHWPKSRFYCGKPLGRNLPPPSTIGEAIDQTRAFEAELRLAQAARRTADTRRATATEESRLVTRIEFLVLQRDRLYSRTGPASDATAEGAAIKKQLMQARTELNDLRNAAKS